MFKIIRKETLAPKIDMMVIRRGDITTGAATVISAIGVGKRAARAIDSYIMGHTESSPQPPEKVLNLSKPQ
jgi:NADPH-dependent glutamate synthase beta subunit-like oxidoreductase